MNVHDKVFGCGGGSKLDYGYAAYGINHNPDKVFSAPIMAGFLGTVGRFTVLPVSFPVCILF